MRPSLRRAALWRFALRTVQTLGALLALAAIFLPASVLGLDPLLVRSGLLLLALIIGASATALNPSGRHRARATAPSTVAGHS